MSKEHAFAERDVDLDADSDVQQVQARNYDPHNGAQADNNAKCDKKVY